MNEFKDFPANHNGMLAAGKIVDITRATHDNLIAFCTHCRSGIGRWVLGGVTDLVIRYSGDPVLIIRASH